MFTEYFRLGGIMMWPLLCCSLVIVAVSIERIWTVVIVHKVIGKSLPDERLCWHGRIIPFFKDIPPSIGLLGTVIGVVECFSLANGRITADAAASGLGVACFTTIAGLTIAILATFLEYILQWLIWQLY